MRKHTGLVALTLASTIASTLGAGDASAKSLCGVLGLEQKHLDKAAELRTQNPDLQPFPDCGIAWYIAGQDSKEAERAAALIRYSQARGFAKSANPGQLPMHEPINFALALRYTDLDDFVAVAALRYSNGKLLFEEPVAIGQFFKKGGTVKDARDWLGSIEAGKLARADFNGLLEKRALDEYHATIAAFKDTFGRRRFDDEFIKNASVMRIQERDLKSMLERPGAEKYSGQGILTRHYYQISDGYWESFDERKRDAIVVFGAYEYKDGPIRNSASMTRLVRLSKHYNVYSLVAEHENDLYAALDRIQDSGRADKVRLLLIETHGNTGVARLGMDSLKGTDEDEKLYLDLGDLELRHHLSSFPKDMVSIFISCYSGKPVSKGRPSLIDVFHVLAAGKTTIGSAGLVNSSNLNLDYERPENSRFVREGKDVTYKRASTVP